MANSYTDVPEIKFHMDHPLMKRIVELKERNFADYGKYDYACKDYEDALDNYDKLLEILDYSILLQLFLHHEELLHVALDWNIHYKDFSNQ